MQSAACASAGGLIPELPDPGDERPAAHPGFDTRVYPGDAAMAQWRVHSPYRWVGYYLPAPCYTGTTWTGRRAALEEMGWNAAVLFVGEQDWAAGAALRMAEEVPREGGPEPVAGAADAAHPRCTRSNLSAERGRSDAAEAVAAAAAEGFPPGTHVYLDVERVESVSDELAAYVRGWTAALLDDGTYVPALYAHRRNAGRLREVAAGAFRSAGRPEAPRLWVAGTGGFDVLGSTPSDSGVDGAHVWQGRLDVEVTWGAATLTIDENVAASPRPSGR